ncbi:MAG TPA: tetratricopeptide repeat protein [Terriglobales bacterium]|nr:tetratricopeptide repeat protein [Terriglobales bacterium]
MVRVRWSALLIPVLLAALAHAQIEKIVIPAGTPEDQALQAISNQTDAQKRITMLQDFVQKFSSNPQAVAYGNWQLSQAYSTAGDNGKALEAGDKALTAAPHNLDILVSQAGVAQQLKNWGKVLDYAAQGGELYNASFGKTKLTNTAATSSESPSDTDKQSYEFLEAAGYNAIAAEQDPKTRMAYIERYTPAFPSSKFAEPVSQYAIYSLQQLNEPERLVAYGEKSLATDPNSLPTLILLANAYSEEPKGADLGKAIAYSRKAIGLAKADSPDATRQQKLSAGVAHSAMGYALMRQDKTPAAITEFKSATSLLKEDPASYQMALYRLGYAYAKLGRLPEARTTLTEAAGIEGAYQQPAKDLLVKVNSAKPRRR